jgi:multiple sugar transport system permease protein
VLASLAFLKGIQGGDLAEGAAIAIFFFPVLAGLAAIVLRIAKKAVVT